MTSIKVTSPETTETHVDIHQQVIDLDHAAESARYFREASELPEGSIEQEAKLQTASYLAQLALNRRVQEYLGNTDTINPR